MLFWAVFFEPVHIILKFSYCLSCSVKSYVMIDNLMYRPKDTPFEDGTFKLTMQFSEEYPNKPPVVRFVSKMFHPNGKDLQICS